MGTRYKHACTFIHIFARVQSWKYIYIYIYIFREPKEHKCKRECSRHMFFQMHWRQINLLNIELCRHFAWMSILFSQLKTFKKIEKNIKKREAGVYNCGLDINDKSTERMNKWLLSKFLNLIMVMTWWIIRSSFLTCVILITMFWLADSSLVSYPVAFTFTCLRFIISKRKNIISVFQNYVILHRHMKFVKAGLWWRFWNRA